ncbi:MAG: prepilin-type N-terminal cleavage/methylation domain-containing protein [Candidatus Aureabacteria bacterium]|nr:prepilin-type N-terminal cleavage/methylation domain-containing protein [Candidatus Auribacterota bacterium]
MRTRPRRGDRRNAVPRGFTIAEVLVAILITSIVAGVIYGSYMGGLRIIYSAQKDIERTEMARLVLDRIAADLSCAFLRAHKDYLVFVGTESSSSEHPSASLTFTCARHTRSERDAPECSLSQVSYSLDPGDHGELFILRREDPNLSDDPFSGGETHPIGEGVSGLKFEYQGGEGSATSWDSRESTSLPTAVRVTVECQTQEEGGGEEGEEAVRYTTFSTDVAIPLGGSWEEAEETPGGQPTPPGRAPLAQPTPNPK